ncbi:MAG: hypothetical protein Q9181_007672 [Wetmoreana brouardii]
MASRFNHSCLPNAHYAWEPTSTCVTTHAIEEIPSGQEIFVNYIADEGTLTWDQRREHLNHWGFICDCRICTEEGRLESDRRRLLMRTQQDNVDNEVRLDLRYGLIMGLLPLYEQERIIYPQLSDAFRLTTDCMLKAAEQTGTRQTYEPNCLDFALTHGRQLLVVDLMCLGHGSAAVNETLAFIRNVRRSQM